MDDKGKHINEINKQNNEIFFLYIHYFANHGQSYWDGMHKFILDHKIKVKNHFFLNKEI